ncbi:hypothetical protein CERSUDRAFT_89989 [Gelatoporia subvermispora B]|uniref:Uncharacterized protein n=1 Tax=Ceriporiopsis subvermispora (strain B) TaxID=914234 RepID=M2RSM0_CERS8|nr:hypothetical protein CERSUDRAFT_89989 [Gelatoporia subvermispora B]
MPELPEVERAARLVRDVALHKRIVRVETTEDDIVYNGISHVEFAKELQDRVVTGVGRYGKVFYIELDGSGRMPVLHFGMTGMLQVRGEKAIYYRETPRKASTDWPPRFMKFILHVRNDESGATTELAFLDARRLGRIRLCSSPLTEPPISTLGFDPIISMPDLEVFTKSVRKRTCPIKALLLDQSFSAGVGNWVADEILYHARIHPEARCHTLTDDQIAPLYRQTLEVCRIAVEVNADDSKFPEDWLFKYRWGKGKGKKYTMRLADGSPATIKWITVGGRTSAYVAELQKLTQIVESEVLGSDGSESELTPITGSEDENKPVRKRKHRVEPTDSPTLSPVKRRSTRSNRVSVTLYEGTKDQGSN